MNFRDSFHRPIARHSRRGFGAVGIAISLALVAGGANAQDDNRTAAAIQAVEQGMYQSEPNHRGVDTAAAIAQVAAIQAVVQGMYQSKANYRGLDSATLATSGVLPDRMISDTQSDELRSPFGGSVSVTSAPPYDTYTIALSDVPVEPCVELLTQDFGRRLVELEAPGIQVARRALSTTEAKSACSQGDRALRWTFF